MKKRTSKRGAAMPIELIIVAGIILVFAFVYVIFFTGIFDKGKGVLGVTPSVLAAKAEICASFNNAVAWCELSPVEGAFVNCQAIKLEYDSKQTEDKQKLTDMDYTCNSNIEAVKCCELKDSGNTKWANVLVNGETCKVWKGGKSDAEFCSGGVESESGLRASCMAGEDLAPNGCTLESGDAPNRTMCGSGKIAKSGMINLRATDTTKYYTCCC